MNQWEFIAIRNLKRYMKALNVSRAELAERLGVSVSTVNRWLNEKDHLCPNQKQLRRCAAVLGIGYRDLFRPYDAELAKELGLLRGYFSLYTAVFSENKVRILDLKRLKREMDDLMFKVLTPYEKRLVVLYYGLTCGGPKSFTVIKDQYGITDYAGPGHMLAKVLELVRGYCKWEAEKEQPVPKQLYIKDVYDANADFMAEANRDACTALEYLKDCRNYLTLGHYHDEYENCVDPDQTPIAILDIKLIPYNQEHLLDWLRKDHVYTLGQLYRLTEREIHELQGVGDVKAKWICALRTSCVNQSNWVWAVGGPDALKEQDDLDQADDDDFFRTTA